MTLADMGNRIAAALAPLGTAATLTRGASSWVCKVVEEDVDRGVVGPFAADERVLVLIGLDGVEPSPRDRITIGAETLTVQRASRSGMGATWMVVVKR